MSPRSRGSATSTDPISAPGGRVDPVLVAYTDRTDVTPGLRDLVEIFGALARASTLRTRLEGLTKLSAWVRQSDPNLHWPAGEPDPAQGRIAERRIGVLTMVLERSSEARTILGRAIESACVETSGLALFAEAGVANDRGLFQELTDRLSRKFLPRPRDDHELANVLTRLLPEEEDADWLAGLDPELYQRFVASLGFKRESVRPIEIAAREAVCLLAARVEALGLSEAMRERRNETNVRSSSFHRLSLATERRLSALEPYERGERNADDAAALAWGVCAADCRRDLERVLATLEKTGVSLDLVYAIDACSRLIERMEHIFAFLDAPRGPERALQVRVLLCELARARVADASLRALARQNGRLLARKVIERAGETGEHYIASDGREYAAMWGSAAIGGLITTATAVFKTLIAGARMPLFVEGALSSVNYSLSFVAIQLAHGTLATKQPSMTAATLAGILKKARGAARTDELAAHVARIARSQLAAALGNILAVSAGTALFAWLWTSVFQRAFLTPEQADYVLHSLDPLSTLTVFYAALTGVLLWLSSMAAGAIENWAVYRRLPRAIAEHRAGVWFGEERMRRIADYFARNVAGVGGSIVLGVLLAMTPIAGKFFGLPLDARHVTLSTGQLALAATSLGREALADPRVHRAMLGIAIIFVMNLSVSFFLALAVAARARNVRRRDGREIVLAIGKLLLKRPRDFLVPPRATRA